MLLIIEIEGSMNEPTMQINGRKETPYLENLTDLSQQKGLSTSLSDRDEVDQVISVLARAGHDDLHRHNPILIGDSKADQSQIVAEVVRRLAFGMTPQELGRREAWALKLDALVAGSPPPEVQQKLIQVLESLRGTTGCVVVVVDDFHYLVGGDLARYPFDAGPWLKPVLARGELQFLGTSSLVNYQRFIESDAALQRRVSPILMR